ncbi:DUF305 domain-containing protein [Erythrobacteraceae bacterium CFH 75059]|nr:DUF305 domain-containing protein [Erythrobacteraceae bacterium CFH 75059]
MAGCGQPQPDNAARSPAATPPAAEAAATPLTPAQEAYSQANARMHAGMAAAVDADPDVAFAKGMIPHHQGAIDMARVQLQYGSDPEMRQLAQEIIRAQEAEIAQLQAFLAARGVAGSTPAPAAPAHHAGGH